MASDINTLVPPTEPLIQRLLQAGKALPQDLKAELLAQRDKTLGPLVDILADDRLIEETSPGGGWAPIHAARLLGEMKAEQAIPRLIELAAEEPLAIIADAAIQALRGMEEMVVEPALAVATSTDNDDLRRTLVGILADTGRKDERIFALLVRVFEQDPDYIAGALGNYGDERAIPLLVGFLERYQMSSDGTMMADHVLIEIQGALEELGAELTLAQQATLDRFNEELERRRLDFIASLERAAAPRAALASPARGKPKIGRNDPCPCGSGKKYKKCCGR